MEISKGLQQEIQLVQNKLKNAIRDHQICVGKLKDDPDNPDILGRIQEIQLHIVALGRCQKQVVQRLRKEVEAFKAENANEVKVSVASLLGLNNNNHITADNEATSDEISEVKVVTNGLDNSRLGAAKEDYEEVVRNGDVARPTQVNVRKKERSLSVETLSAEEEVMEVVRVDENSRQKRRQEQPISPPVESKVNCKAQLNFLEILGLITMSKFTELQNRRAERKRRSTANPQFVYSNWEIPTKRKRHSYLQSAGNVPQTRQTTARLNGPSPPPAVNKPTAAVGPPKSTSPVTRTIAKTLIPTQKATTRPNILRNIAESRVFVSKARIENGNGQVQLSSGTKSSQSTSNNKTVHIPGLPLGLTIERIENDSAVCINCRNPGTLTNCDNCEANYHVSCHTISPPPPRLCPKCALRLKDGSGQATIKKNDELVAASYAPGVAGKAGEDPEVNKATCGLYKVGAAKQQQQQQQQQVVGRGVNQLPSSTFLIPITANPLASAGAFNQSDSVLGPESSSLNVLKSSGNSDASAFANNSPDEISYNTSLVIGHQLSRSSITYVPQSQSHVSYAYQLPVSASESGQSYVIFKKIADPGKPLEGSQAPEGKSFVATGSGYNSSRSGEGGTGQSEVTITSASVQLEQVTGRLAESLARGWRKSTTRAIPGLNRIAPADGKSITITAEHADGNDVDKLSDGPHNNVRGGSTSARDHQHRQFAGRVRSLGRRPSEASTSAAGRNLLEVECLELEITPTASQTEQRQGVLARKKSKSKPSSGLLNPVLTGYNKSDTLAGDSDGSQQQQQGSTAGNDGNLSAALGNETDESLVEELPRDEPVGGQSNCSELASSTEHVKLEEAHLSAPLRAKLVRDEDRTSLASLGDQPVSRSRKIARTLSSRRRTTEDRARTPPLAKALDAASKQERSRPRILMRPERKSLDSRDSVLSENLAGSGKNVARDFVTFERRFEGRIAKEEKERGGGSSSDTDSVEDESSQEASTSERTSSKAFSSRTKSKEERKEEGEAEQTDEEDVESVDMVDDEDIDEEEEEEVIEEEEEEEEDQEDCPILDEDINERVNERLGISTVSPESMQVLEQFESAMLQVDSGDLTANP